ncbi:MAG: B12-binding domain-containing radical SAM protein [Methanobacteriaceae archaeon]|nr:B12-binding domain-containing radical SAM protein [Methanobacteriaceae archaeon]
MNKKIDVLLINPYDENALKNALGFITPPINLMYLASSLEKESYSVKIVDDDLLQKGYKNVSELAEKLNPQVVAVTATTSTIKSGLKYLELAKNILPNSLTVIGGPHATFLPYETLKGSETLDVVVKGEGEETMLDLASQSTESIPDLEDVRGIVFRDSNNGNLKSTPPRPLIKDLDSLPFPARHLVPFDSYGASKEQTGGIITSRGCAYSCNYCSSSLIMGKKFRSRSPDNVVDEIEELIDQYQIRDIGFMDDTFMLNKRRANDIANEIKARDLDLSFVASSRVDRVDQKLLQNLKNSGMKTIYYGVESGSQRILDLMKKGITLKQAEDAVKIAKNVDLEVLTSFILGYPGETQEDMNKTIDFSTKLDSDYCQYSILTPFPGTPIYNELNDKNLIDNDDWDKYTVLKPVLKYNEMGLNKNMVERKLAIAYLKYYARPKYLLNHRHMFKVILQTVIRSFILPKLIGGTGKGWYQNIENKSSSK